MKCASWQMAALGCLTAACSGPGNTGRSGPSADLVAAVPWTNGAIPLRDASGLLVSPSEPVYPPIGANRPDPGSRPVDCSALSGIELSPFGVQTFEPIPSPNIPDPVGVAEGWSSYDDETIGAFRVPGDATWYSDLVGPVRRFSEAWGLAADRISNGPNCDGQPNDWAFHFRGGRFNYFGAGAEHALGGLDVTSSDGVTFWARRGPDGQPGVLFALQDKHTSDLANRGNQAFCRRIKKCRVKCQNGSACVPAYPDAPTATYRCVDPALGLPPIAEPAFKEELYPLCGPSACRSPGTGNPEGPYYPDLDFDDEFAGRVSVPPTECKFYEFSGSQADMYCYAGEPPPPDEERCGDAWTAPVRLSTDWQLYIIPFSEFRQVGFAKRAPFLDLHAIYMMALLFPVGFADMYIDNVSFYRRRR